MSYSEREELNLKLKEQVAKKAAGYINDNDTIFIGPGTTTEMVLKYIKTKNNTIITNNYIFVNRRKMFYLHVLSKLCFWMYVIIQSKNILVNIVILI